MTRTSASSRDPHSRRGSLTQPLQISSDRINSWRHGVEGNPSRPLSMAAAITTATTTTTPARSERSLSPNKMVRTPMTPSRANHASEARRQPYTAAASPVLLPTSPTISVRSNRTSEPPRGETPALPTPSFSFRSFDSEADALRIDSAGVSYSFWNLNKWRNMGQARGNGSENPSSPSVPEQERSVSSPPKFEEVVLRTDRRKSSGADIPVREKGFDNRRKSNNVSYLGPSPLEERDENEGFLAPPDRPMTNRSGRSGSVMSRLSSELTASDEGDEMECVKCGSHDFRAKRVGGQQRLLCGKCGRMVDL
jgi:hypothetical protein